MPRKKIFIHWHIDLSFIYLSATQLSANPQRREEATCFFDSVVAGAEADLIFFNAEEKKKCCSDLSKPPSAFGKSLPIKWEYAALCSVHSALYHYKSSSLHPYSGFGEGNLHTCIIHNWKVSVHTFNMWCHVGCHEVQAQRISVAFKLNWVLTAFCAVAQPREVFSWSYKHTQHWLWQWI